MKAVWAVLALALVGLAGWLALLQLEQNAGLRELIAAVNRLPAEEQRKPIACSREALADGAERDALREALPHLEQPKWRAAAFCLLGDAPAALAAYEQAAAEGDEEAVLEEYYLQARVGNMAAARQDLSGVEFTIQELQRFFNGVVELKQNVDVLPLAQRAVELYPDEAEGWKLWRDAGREYERAADWQGALETYLAGMRAQEAAGVRVGRGSFELAAGKIYQTRLEPRDLKAALGCYNAAMEGGDFLAAAEASSAYMYRGEVYRGLRPAYSAGQALGEFRRALELEPKNYYAMLDMASVYLYDLKDYPAAELTIQRAIGLKPEIASAYLMRGDAYREQGDLQNAVAAYGDALTRQPGYTAALERLAAARAELEKQAP